MLWCIVVSRVRYVAVGHAMVKIEPVLCMEVADTPWSRWN
jgi:hypothetical protein